MTTKTTISALPTDVELKPVTRIGPNKFQVTLTSAAGYEVEHTMTTPMVMQMVGDP